jgi:hypothetical protein
MTDRPATLQQAIIHFSNKDVAHDYLVNLRWSDGVVCPKCGGLEHSYLTTRKTWKCKACKKQFSVKNGTIFENSPIGLDKWLPCVWMIPRRCATTAERGTMAMKIITWRDPVHRRIPGAGVAGRDVSDRKEKGNE